jgi:hypothetical protein
VPRLVVNVESKQRSRIHSSPAAFQFYVAERRTISNRGIRLARGETSLTCRAFDMAYSFQSTSTRGEHTLELGVTPRHQGDRVASQEDRIATEPLRGHYSQYHHTDLRDRRATKALSSSLDVVYSGYTRSLCSLYLNPFARCSHDARNSACSALICCFPFQSRRLDQDVRCRYRTSRRGVSPRAFTVVNSRAQRAKNANIGPMRRNKA